jgi:hypothetical protein
MTATTPPPLAVVPKNASEEIRVALDEWQGRQLLDIRVTTQLTEATDIWSPTKKGLTVQVGQLPALIEALQAAQAAIAGGRCG